MPALPDALTVTLWVVVDLANAVLYGHALGNL